MATLSTALVLAQLGTPAGSANAIATFPRARDAFGKERIVQITYTLLGTEATNDLLRLTLLKHGDRVLAARSRVTCEALGTAFTASFGDLSNASRYSGTLTLTSIADQSFAAAAGTDLYVPTDIVNIPQPAATADQTVVVMKIVLATTPTAGKKLLITLSVVSE